MRNHQHIDKGHQAGQWVMQGNADGPGGTLGILVAVLMALFALAIGLSIFTL